MMLPNAEYVDEIDGGGWMHVRHLPKSMKWYKAKDQLAGTEEYGTPYDEDQEWTIPFNNVEFNQFLFSSGDLKKWLVIGKEAILGE